MQSTLNKFLASKVVDGECFIISPSRSYQHDETDYDRQYGLGQFSIAELEAEAGFIMDLCAAHGLPAGASILEIGCGTGRISLGLAMQRAVGHLLITDPSPAFCRIVQRKLLGIDYLAQRIDFGVLLAEDVGLLPEGAVSLILLRSVLHHVADVDGFLRSAASVLSPGGLLVCEEPYYDGYLMMGMVAQFIEGALANDGFVCSPKERELIATFVASMQFYSRRDVDKSAAEDKHLFRPDELMASGRSIGLELHHYPNWRMTLSPERNAAGLPGFFFRFFCDYILYCMDWPREFVDKVSAAMKPYFQYFEPIENAGNTAPYCFGTFVFVKR